MASNDNLDQGDSVWQHQSRSDPGEARPLPLPRRRASSPARGSLISDPNSDDEEGPKSAVKTAIKNARSRADLIAVYRTHVQASGSQTPHIDAWIRRVPQLTKGKPLWQDRELLSCFEEAAYNLTSSPTTSTSKLAGLFWASAKTNYTGLAALKPKIEARILSEGGELDPIDVCLCLWAFSQKATGRPSAAVLHQLVGSIKRRAADFQVPMGVATVLWSLAKLGQMDLFRDAEEALRPVLVRLGEERAFEAQNVSNIIWSYGSTGLRPQTAVVTALMTSLLHLAGKSLFEGQAIANSLWALAKLGLTAEFKTAEAALRPKLLRLPVDQVLKPQELSNVLWSFGALRLRPERTVLRALIDVVVVKARQFNQNDIAFLLGALARLGLVAEFCEVEGSLRPVLLAESRLQMSDLQPHAAANILQAFGELGVEPEPELLQTLCAACMKKIGEYQVRDIAQVLLAFAELGVEPPPQTLLSLLQAMVSNVQQCNHRHAANVAWALAILARCMCAPVLCTSPWLQVAAEALSQRLRDLGSGSFSDEELSQLFQAHLLLRSVAPLRLPEALVSRSEVAWRQQVDANCRISELQLDVARALKTIGIEPELKMCTDDGLFRVQLALKDTRIALEVCGPYRFSINTRRLSGPTLARKVLLEERGWHVVHVYYYQWDELRSDVDKAQFLSALLLGASIPKGPPGAYGAAPVYDHAASFPGGLFPPPMHAHPHTHALPMMQHGMHPGYGLTYPPAQGPYPQDLLNQFLAMNLQGGVQGPPGGAEMGTGSGQSQMYRALGGDPARFIY